MDMREAHDSIDAAIKDLASSIRRNTNTYTDYPTAIIDENIERMEKLIVIRAALRQLYEVPETKDSEPDENIVGEMTSEQLEPVEMNTQTGEGNEPEPS